MAASRHNATLTSAKLATASADAAPVARGTDMTAEHPSYEEVAAQHRDRPTAHDGLVSLAGQNCNRAACCPLGDVAAWLVGWRPLGQWRFALAVCG